MGWSPICFRPPNLSKNWRNHERLVCSLRDMQFVLRELVGLDEMARLPGCEEVTPDLVDAILEEAAKLACEVLAPLNKQGDTQGCKLKDHAVTTPDGFKQAYRQFIDGGWTMLGL